MNIIILCGGKGERFSKNVKHFLSEPFINFLKLSKYNIIKIFDEKIFGIELINNIIIKDIFITIFIKTYNKFIINEAKLK